MAIYHFRRLAAPLSLILLLCFSGEMLTQLEVQMPEVALINTITVKALNHRNTAITTAASASNDTVPSRAEANDWFQADRFNAIPFIENDCTYVEHICHSSGRWWYQPTVGAKQPEFTLRTELRGAPGYPKNVRVKAMEDSLMNDRKCPESPIPNHLVMHSFYNSMLGEFYARILVGLHELARSQTDNFEDFVEQTQLYLHLYDRNDKSMLDSHHLFTDAFSTHPLLDFKSLLHNTGCQCVRRLIMCGYKETDDGVGNKVVTPNFSISPQESAGWRNEMYQELRETIRRRVILENPLVQQDIEVYREKVLTAEGIESPFDDWKVIGLAQRTGRRRWVNLVKNKQECNNALRRHKIICTEVNVEVKESHPYHQAVMHGALDGLIGIHGAQLTEAVWMKPGSLVVEFLPWLHRELKYEGGWTRRVKQATPIGFIFADTDLNHVGFPLQRQSAPYCRGLQGEEEIQCWRDHNWDGRDFEGTEDSIVDAVKMFFVKPAQSCTEYREMAGDNYVLYNIQCKTGNDNVPSPHHFFWKKGLLDIPKYTVY
jgi:hypothetical protein